MAEQAQPQVGEDALADPARQVRLPEACRPADHARDDERGHDHGEPLQVPLVDPLVDRELREVGRSERCSRCDEQR